PPCLNYSSHPSLAQLAKQFVFPLEGLRISVLLNPPRVECASTPGAQKNNIGRCWPYDLTLYHLQHRIINGAPRHVGRPIALQNAYTIIMRPRKLHFFEMVRGVLTVRTAPFTCDMERDRSPTEIPHFLSPHSSSAPWTPTRSP